MSDYILRWTVASKAVVEMGAHLYYQAIRIEAEGLKGAPDVTARVEIRNGVPDIVDFRIKAKPSGRAVRTADLNDWQPLEGLAINALRTFAMSKEPSRTAGQLAFGPIGERDFWRIAGGSEGAQANRSGPSIAELEEVARVYRDAIERHPTATVQVMLGYSRRTAARRVQQARAAGLLPDTTPGKKKG